MGGKSSAWKVLKVLILYILKLFPTLYKYGKLVLRKGLWRVYAVKKGGLYSFLLAVSVSLVGNSEALMQSFQSMTPAPIFTAWGKDLAGSYFAIKEQLLLVDTASGFQYLDIVVTIAIKASTIAAFFLGARYVLEFVDRDMSPLLVYGMPAVFFLAISWGVTGKVPVLHDFGFFAETLPELFEFGKLNPFASPDPDTVNRSVQMVVNESVNRSLERSLNGSMNASAG